MTATYPRYPLNPDPTLHRIRIEGLTAPKLFSRAANEVNLADMGFTAVVECCVAYLISFAGSLWSQWNLSRLRVGESAAASGAEALLLSYHLKPLLSLWNLNLQPEFEPQWSVFLNEATDMMDTAPLSKKQLFLGLVTKLRT